MVTHLHVHSHYSLLNAVPSPTALAKKAKEMGMSALAITDYGSLYAAMEFYLACKSEEVKPIIGTTGFMCEAEDISIKQSGDLRHQLVLIAKNKTGYQNLIKLMSIASLEGFYYVPRFDRNLLKQYSEGLICLSGSISGEIPRMIKLGKSDEEILEKIKWYQSIFGDDFYMEIAHHPEVEDFKLITDKLIEISDKHSIPKVACQQTFYLEKDHAEAHDLLLCIRDDKTIDDPSRFSIKDGDYSFLSEDEMNDLFRDTPDALENTQKIANKCDLDLTPDGWVFPKVEIRKDCKDADEMLKKEAYEGIERRKGRPATQEESKRIDYELDIIKEKGFSSYFILCKEITDYMHSENIATTTRGSAAGSLVSYAIGVTRADPLYFKLPFERFLNPMRPKAPDIDLDIEARRREDVINWTRKKYGEENVAQIITFGTLSAKNVIKDVARAFKKPFSETNEITKLIPVKWGKTDLKSALEEVDELKAWGKKDPIYQKIFDIGVVLEGCPRHTSVHAAGVLITPDAVTNYVPVARDPRSNMPVTQYNMVMLEELGLIKMDYLGLKNLAIITDCIDSVRARRGEEVNVEKIELDDPNAFKLLSDGNTFGLFQLESTGMKRYLKELKPTTIFDIQAMLALYRPGPLENIGKYIQAKNDPSKISYLHPDLEPILERTFGVLVYQDDVLMLAINLAGYTWLDADKFRKGMGKKIASVIEAERKKFTEGCVKNGYGIDLAEKLFDLLGPFAGYGFNKAHAAAYALLSYQTAYLKSNFTIEYMAALLQTEADDIEKTTNNINECENMGITVLPPDINDSFTNFTSLDEKTIRFGLRAIKGLGIDTVKAIIKERKNNGLFESIQDFIKRVPHEFVNKKSMEALIYSGSFDNLEDRNKLALNLDTLLEYSKACSSEKECGQSSLFDLTDEVDSPSLHLDEAPKLGHLQRLEQEKSMLGLYISGHPLDGLKNYLRKKGLIYEKLEKKLVGQINTAIGLIQGLRVSKTKTGELMASFTLEDPTGFINCLIFPKVYSAYSKNLEEGKLCTVTGTLQYRKSDDSYTVIGREMSFIKLESARKVAKESGLYSDKWKVSEIRKEIHRQKEEAELGGEEGSTYEESGIMEGEAKIEKQETKDIDLGSSGKESEIFVLETRGTNCILRLPADVSRQKLSDLKDILDDQKAGDKDFVIQISETQLPYNRKIELDEYFEEDLNEILN